MKQVGSWSGSDKKKKNVGSFRSGSTKKRNVGASSHDGTGITTAVELIYTCGRVFRMVRGLLGPSPRFDEIIETKLPYRNRLRKISKPRCPTDSVDSY